jgi:hypothetical protein
LPPIHADVDRGGGRLESRDDDDDDDDARALRENAWAATV